MVLDGVLVAMLARCDEPWLAFRPIGVDQVDLGGLVVVGLDGDEARGLGLADPDVEALVLLLVDQHVGLAWRAQAVAVDVEGALVAVEPYVEQRLAVGAPDDRAASLVQGLPHALALVDVADVDGELP